MKDAPLWVYLVFLIVCPLVVIVISLMGEPAWGAVGLTIAIVLYPSYLALQWIRDLIKGSAKLGDLAKSPTQLQAEDRAALEAAAREAENSNPELATQLRESASQIVPVDKRSRAEKIAVLCILLALLIGIVVLAAIFMRN